MKWPVVAKAQAEEPGCRQGHSGISPITNPPKDSRSLCRTPHSRDLATTVAESCPHMGPCSPCVCLQDTQLWPESGREQEGLAEVTYPTPVTSQDPSIPHPKVSFHIPFSRGSPPCHLLGGRIREEGGAMTHLFLRERGPRTISASSGQADEGRSKGVL